ncbi:MAG: FecR domain-containing protein [Chloracidobacterium sp.]|nr:FecR domain-containing protein [Chloracidobacterium sp.]
MIKNRVSLALLVSFLLPLGLGVTAKAQYLISTKAGFVNRVEGQVYILRSDSEDGEKTRASLGTQMRDGDRLIVGDKGFAETLLNPGSYLRLGENAEIRAASIDLNSVRFELIKGSVIAEIGQIDKNSPIELMTPNGALTIAKAGLYRIDVKDSSTQVAVRQGEIQLGTPSDLATRDLPKIKSGKVATLNGSAESVQSDIAKLDKDAVDNFDTWSFDRAQALTAANVKALSQSGSGLLTSGWYYDPFFNFYTFVPTRSWFASPYGFGFFNNYFDSYAYTPYYYYPRTNYLRNSGNVSRAVVPSNVSPRVVSGNNSSAVRSATDHRMAGGGFSPRSGGYSNSGQWRGASSGVNSSSSRSSSVSSQSRSSGGFSRSSGGASSAGGAARSSSPRGR